MMQYNLLLRYKKGILKTQTEDISSLIVSFIYKQIMVFSSYDSDFFLETLRTIYISKTYWGTNWSAQKIFILSAVKIINTMQYNELLRSKVHLIIIFSYYFLYIEQKYLLGNYYGTMQYNELLRLIKYYQYF